MMKKINLIDDVESLAEDFMKIFKKYSIKDFGGNNFPIYELRYLYDVLGLDRVFLDFIISDKTSSLIDEINNLIKHKKLSFIAELEVGEDVNFISNGQKIGKLNLATCIAKLYPTSIVYEYKKNILKKEINYKNYRHLKTSNFKQTIVKSKQIITIRSSDLSAEIIKLNSRINSIEEKLLNYKTKLKALKEADENNAKINLSQMPYLAVYSFYCSNMIENNIKSVEADKQASLYLLKSLHELRCKTPKTDCAINCYNIIKAKKELKNFLKEDLNIKGI